MAQFADDQSSGYGGNDQSGGMGGQGGDQSGGMGGGGGFGGGGDQSGGMGGSDMSGQGGGYGGEDCAWVRTTSCYWLPLLPNRCHLQGAGQLSARSSCVLVLHAGDQSGGGYSGDQSGGDQSNY